MTDFVNCTVCNCKIFDGEGRFNLPTGTKCIKCNEKPQKKPKNVNIAGYKIPLKLEQYADKVEFTRRAAIYGQSREDPLIVMRALSDRVEIHKKIFKITGHDHESMEEEPMKIRNALEKWLNKNTMTAPQKDGLV